MCFVRDQEWWWSGALVDRIESCSMASPACFGILRLVFFRENPVPVRARVGKRTTTWTHGIMETMKRIMQMVLPEPLILSDILCCFVPILEDESTNYWGNFQMKHFLEIVAKVSWINIEATFESVPEPFRHFVACVLSCDTSFLLQMTCHKIAKKQWNVYGSRPCTSVKRDLIWHLFGQLPLVQQFSMHWVFWQRTLS